MYEVSNRKCFGGPYKVPITQFNRQTWWPPKWIECDCGEHAEHIFTEKREPLSNKTLALRHVPSRIPNYRIYNELYFVGK